MYILLILVHTVFFFIAHLLGNVLLQGGFVLLLIFFILYFSPIFFSGNDSASSSSTITLPDIEISPKKSIIIPLILTYVGIYILAFTVSSDIGTKFEINTYILLFIYLLFSGYVLVFDVENSFFRDALRFHLVCSYITVFFQLVYYFIFPSSISIIQILFLGVMIAFSVLFFTQSDEEGEWLFLAFLLATLISLDTIIVYFFPQIHIFTLVGITTLIAIALFEYSPKLLFFRRFLEPSRVLLLTLTLLSSLVLMASVWFSYYLFMWFLPIVSIFLLSVHIRYCNYISYLGGISILFFLYSYLFYPLLLSGQTLSGLLFIFFFSFCIIGNTYFWEERYEYDFSLLHYSSIAFSIIASFYGLLLVGWSGGLTQFLAFSLFLLAALFLLSYFRFQYNKKQ